jgi:hypothetical protein
LVSAALRCGLHSITDAQLSPLARCRSFLEKFLPHELSSRLSPMQQIGVNGGLLNLLA